MALRTSNETGGGNWGTAATWDTGVPVNGDTFLIKNGDSVVMNADHIGAGGIAMGASTIEAGGTLISETAAGDYSLVMNGDLTNNGTIQAGTSTGTPLPAGTTFTVGFNSGSNSIVNHVTTGRCYFYCLEPTLKYVSLTAQEPAAETDLAVDDDLTGDIWAAGDTVHINDVLTSSSRDAEEAVIDTITTGPDVVAIVAGGLAAQKEIGAAVVLVTRNIRLIDSTDYMIKTGTSHEIYAEFSPGTGYGIDNISNSTIGGCINSASNRNATNRLINCTLVGAVTGGSSGCASSQSVNFEAALVTGNIYAATAGMGLNIDADSVFVGNTFGYSACTSVGFNGTLIGGISIFIDCSGIVFSGTADNFGQLTQRMSGILCANAIINSTCTNVFLDTGNAVAFNTLMAAGTEYNDYNGTSRAAWNYSESLDHNQVANAFKAWCRGGIVTSQTASPPTGFDRWYEHACEYVATGSFPCFRQFETVVQPGTAIEVEGFIRIADGEDLGTDPPALQIIDKFADPLIDSTQSPLDEDEIPEPDGGVEAGWQAVSVIWANSGDSPRTVIVRMYASVADVGAAVDVDEVWNIADYQDQIADILKKVKRLGPTGEIA